MRLGQIARKLGVSQAEIVRYLSSQNLSIEDGSNVKLEEAHLRSLYAHFAPSENFETKEIAQEPASSFSATDNDTNAKPVSDVATVSDSFTESETKDEAPTEPDPMPATSAGDQSETIRAPRIELAGLKVVGKIELPQPKKKESNSSEELAKVSTSEAPVTDAEGVLRPAETPRVDGGVSESRRGKERSHNRDGRRSDDNRRSQNKQPREQRSYKNPIAAQREREMEEERQRRKEKAELDKERRTQNYQKRVKHSPPTKAARLIEEQVEQIDEALLKDEPKGWFGKFMKWLRT